MKQENNFNTEQDNIDESNNTETFTPEEPEVRTFSGVIVLLALVALALGGYIIFNKVLKIEPAIDAPKDKPANEVEKSNEFAYDNYSLKLPKAIDSVRDIYSLYVKKESDIEYSIYGRYTREEDILVANITCDTKIAFDYNTMDVDNGKFYYVIRSEVKGNVFELYYIDLNDLSLGAKKLNEFNEIFKEDNLYTVSEVNTYYSSQIYVKGDEIYYTSFKDRSIKKYNTKTGTIKPLISNILWNEYFIDKRNNHIFYKSGSNFYLTDLDGKNRVNIKNVDYSETNFWLKAYYNNKPIYGFKNNTKNTIDIYAYNYTTKRFIEVAKSVNYFNIRYNNIDPKLTKDPKVVGCIYIA